MDPAEVIAIEVRQFIGEGIRSLVPNVVGRTEEAQARKAVYTSNPQWTEETFLERVTQTSGKGEAEVARTILNWARQRELRVTWGRGRTEARFIRCWTWSTEASIQQQYAMGSTLSTDAAACDETSFRHAGDAIRAGRAFEGGYRLGFRSGAEVPR